jgi:hypothetical protein
MKPKILINTITDWNEPPRARHQFTFALAKKIPVGFVARNKTGWFDIRISEPQKNITLIEPVFPIDYRFRYRLPVINELYQKWLFSKLNKLLPGRIVVNFDFTATCLRAFYKDSIYYCHDEYVGNSKYKCRIIDRYIAFCEKEVAKNSRFCIATSRYLKEKLTMYNPSTYEILLGASIEGNSFIPEAVVHKDDRIVVGLMGVINENHSSLEVVNTILKDPLFHLILIGPIEDSFRKKIKHRGNLELTGVLKGDNLVRKLSTLDVGLALYNMRSVNPGTTPNKLWQYMALGKPTVVSNLPNLRSMVFPEKSVYILLDENCIGQSIKEAYTENSVELSRNRIAYAKENTWDHRIEQFLEIAQSCSLPI